MDRRRYLGMVAGVSALAGCSRIGTTTTELRPVGEKTEMRETHLLFGEEGRRLLTYTVRHGEFDATGKIPLRLSLWHHADTHLDSFRTVIRAPAGGGQPITSVYLKSPWYDSETDLRFHRGDNGNASVLAADDLGTIGDGTLTLELILDPASMPETLTVGVSGTFELSGSGSLDDAYRADGTTTVEISRDG